MEFTSQICTTEEQSERLLALGLKRETADCRHWAYTKDSKGNSIPKSNQKWFTRIGTEESVQVCGFMDATFIPAWSLHRLIEMMPTAIPDKSGITHCFTIDGAIDIFQSYDWFFSQFYTALCTLFLRKKLSIWDFHQKIFSLILYKLYK
jgi:hypothetical protein